MIDMGGLISPVYASAPTLCALDDMITGIFDKIWPFIGMALFFMFLYGGAMWMLSSGDPGKVSQATGTMLWAFVGAVILVMVMVIIGTLESILGLPAGTLRVFEIC